MIKSLFSLDVCIKQRFLHFQFKRRPFGVELWTEISNASFLVGHFDTFLSILILILTPALHISSDVKNFIR